MAKDDVDDLDSSFAFEIFSHHVVCLPRIRSSSLARFLPVSKYTKRLSVVFRRPSMLFYITFCNNNNIFSLTSIHSCGWIRLRVVLLRVQGHKLILPPSELPVNIDHFT